MTASQQTRLQVSNSLNAIKCKSLNGEILSILYCEPWLYITIFVKFDITSFGDFYKVTVVWHVQGVCLWGPDLKSIAIER